MDLMSYEELRKIQNAERDNKALQEIDTTFFEKVREYIRTKENLIKENQGKDNTFAKQTYEKAQQELGNIKKILDDIFARRQRKIIMQAFTNVAARVHNTEQMIAEEEKLYQGVISLLKKSKDSFFEKIENNKLAENTELEKKEENLKLIRFVDEVPSFVWKDSKTYGPFAKEDVVNTPVEVGEILIKQGKAIEIVVGDE